jgi:oligopeptide transport system substrate-binding protein
MRSLPVTRRSLSFSFALVCAGLILTGCSRGSRSHTGTQQVFRYPIRIEPSTLDPALSPDLDTNELLQNVYEGLVTFDTNNAVAPSLAERWDVSPDGKTYTFHLRAALFHNGRMVIADDVKYSLERALWKETRSPVAANYLAGIVGLEAVTSGLRRGLEGVKVLDSRTVSIALDHPRGYFLGSLAYPTGNVVCREAVEKNGGRIDGPAQAIGTGPFRMAEYHSHARVVLTAFESYWGGRPKLDRIERPVVLDFQTSRAKYLAGETDLCLPAFSDFKNDRNDPRLKAEARVIPQAGVWYLAMQQRLQPAFRNPLVRKAFAQAIDKDEICKLACQGLLPRAEGFVPPGVPGYNPKIRALPYDPQAAKRLLEQAGYPNGRNFPHLTLVYLQNQPEIEACAQIVRAHLKENLGVEVDLQAREAATFFSDTGAKENVAFFFTGWLADYIDPQDFLSTMLRSGAKLNHLGYSNPAFDALCDRADALQEMDKRIPLYQQADQIVADEVPVIPIYYAGQPVLVKPYVRDYPINLLNLAMPHKTTSVKR